MQNKSGEILETNSISAGLDYPGVGPEHSYLADKKRAKYVKVYDEEALEAFYRVSKIEGIIPALETAHAIAATCVGLGNHLTPPKDASGMPVPGFDGNILVYFMIQNCHYFNDFQRCTLTLRSLLSILFY